MKLKEPFVVFTNLVFLIPLYFAIIQGSYTHASIIFLVLVFSTWLHIIKPPGTMWPSEMHKLNAKQKLFLHIDEFLAYCLIIFNLFVFWTNDFPLNFWYALLVGLLGIVFLYFPKQQNKYEFFHGTWYLLSGLVTLFAVLA